MGTSVWNTDCVELCTNFCCGAVVFCASSCFCASLSSAEVIRELTDVPAFFEDPVECVDQPRLEVAVPQLYDVRLKAALCEFFLTSAVRGNRLLFEALGSGDA